MNKSDGGSAFPVVTTDCDVLALGMSKRELYALAAMQGYLAYHGNKKMKIGLTVNCKTIYESEKERTKRIATDAFADADAMIEFEKQEEKDGLSEQE